MNAFVILNVVFFILSIVGMIIAVVGVIISFVQKDRDEEKEYFLMAAKILFLSVVVFCLMIFVFNEVGL